VRADAPGSSQLNVRSGGDGGSPPDPPRFFRARLGGKGVQPANKPSNKDEGFPSLKALENQEKKIPTRAEIESALAVQDLMHADVRHACDRRDLAQASAILSGGADSRAPFLIGGCAALRGPLHAVEVGHRSETATVGLVLIPRARLKVRRQRQLRHERPGVCVRHLDLAVEVAERLADAAVGLVADHLEAGGERTFGAHRGLLRGSHALRILSGWGFVK